MNLTHLLADYIYKIEYEKFPEHIVEKAKLCLLDWIGVTLAGYKEPISNITYGLIEMLGSEKQATILGKGSKTNLLFAALVNGTNSHALDFDDVHVETPGHPSAPLIPAILSLAEWKETSGRDFITALITGVQIFFSIAEANMPYHYNEGWHNTGTMGHLSAAAASAKLLRLDNRQIINAIGIGTTQAAGLQNVFGTMCKPFHAGKAAMDGLLAALLAEKNFTSSDDIIGGKGGFLEVYSSKSTPEAFEDALKSNFLIEGVRFKLYPSCYATHAAIECMISLRNQHEINPDEIMEIQCAVYPRCLQISATSEPETGLEGKFSVQYCLAAALLEGKVLLDSFTDSNVKKDSITDVMNKVKLLPNNSYTKKRTTEVVIKFKNGKTIQEKVSLSELFKEPGQERESITQKFKDITYSLMPKEKADQIVESISSLEKIKNMADIVALCQY